MWGFDPIYLEPSGSGVYGFQTWEFFGKGWETSFESRFYVCSLVVELKGIAAAEPCADCSQAFQLFPALMETDCDPAFVEDELFTSIEAIGMAPMTTATYEGQDTPWPEQSQAAWGRYGGEAWAAQGWAYPAELDVGKEASGAWDGQKPFQFWPAYAWDVSGL